MSRIIPIIAIAGALGAAAHSARAQEYSAMFAETGIGGVIETLEAAATTSASDRFVLGSAYFLRGVESAFQARYQTDLGDTSIPLPGLSAQLPSNPDPAPFTPDLFEELFIALMADMDKALGQLETIADTDEVAVKIDLGDLWFDVNANGRRDPGEDLLPIFVSTFASPWEVDAILSGLAEAGGPPTVRFDTADAAWLAAYAHVLSGTGELVIAFDTVPVIADVMASRARMIALSGETSQFLVFSSEDSEIADVLAVVLGIIEQQPDPEGIRRARSHFKAMLDQNRVFWARLGAEADNDQEWIPAAGQTSALPLAFPEGVEAGWVAVLDEVEMILDGELLIPHWRTGGNAGINLASWVENPGPLGLIDVLQGRALAPHMERGRVADFRAMAEFDRMTGGNFALFALMLN